MRLSRIAVAISLAALAFTSVHAADIDRPAPVIPVESEPAPKLVVYPPLAEPLARGVTTTPDNSEPRTSLLCRMVPEV